MKSIKKVMFILFLIVVVFFVFYFLAFRETTWGGWDPTSEAALTLDSKELQWVDDFQKINDCKIDYIGLDNAFMEDSIIHVDIFCNKNASLSQKILNQGDVLVKEQCKSFLLNSTTKRTQRYIQFSFHDVNPKEKINSLNFKYLFDKDLDSIIKIE